MNNVNKDNWRSLDINVDSLWLIKEREKSGKHSNLYHGNFVPQVPNQLIKRYTDEGDTIMELFTGSGTTLFECENLNRNYIGYDINQDILSYVVNKMDNSSKIKYVVNNCDVTNTDFFNSSTISSFKKIGCKAVDFLIMHPPYMNIVKFTDRPEDLSQIDKLDVFLDKILLSVQNSLKYLKRNKYFAIVIGDIYKKSEVIPLGFYVMYTIKKNFEVKMKGIIIKNIEGNRGKLGCQNIWKYRALKSDYFLFKHEYIFVFKKEY